MKNGIKAHKQYLNTLRAEMTLLRKKFENGNLEGHERDRIDDLAIDIKAKEQELRGFE